MILALLAAAAANGAVFTLVVSDGSAMTRFNYANAAACERARQAIIRQTTPRMPPTKPGEYPAYIPGPPRTTVFCVPR